MGMAENRSRCTRVMNNEHKAFLNLLRLPGTIDAGQTAILLGTSEANIPILVTKSFLEPLGKNLAANAPKRFSSAAIEALARDPEKMSRMHHLISSHWRIRNGTPPRNGSGRAKQGRTLAGRTSPLDTSGDVRAGS